MEVTAYGQKQQMIDCRTGKKSNNMEGGSHLLHLTLSEASEIIDEYENSDDNGWFYNYTRTVTYENNGCYLISIPACERFEFRASALGGSLLFASYSGRDGAYAESSFNYSEGIPPYRKPEIIIENWEGGIIEFECKESRISKQMAEIETEEGVKTVDDTYVDVDFRGWSVYEGTLTAWVESDYASKVNLIKVSDRPLFVGEIEPLVSNYDGCSYPIYISEFPYAGMNFVDHPYPYIWIGAEEWLPQTFVPMFGSGYEVNFNTVHSDIGFQFSNYLSGTIYMEIDNDNMTARFYTYGEVSNDVDEIENNNLRIEDDMIYLSQDEDYSVFNFKGVVMASGHSDQISISDLPEDIYILRFGNKSIRFKH